MEQKKRRHAGGEASARAPEGAESAGKAGGAAGLGAAEALKMLDVPCPGCGSRDVSPAETQDGARCGACGLEFDGRQALLSFLGMPAPGQGFRMACLDLFLKQARKDGMTDKDVPIFVPELAVLGAAAVRTLMRDDFVSVSGMNRIMLLLDAALGAGAAAAVMWHADFSRLSSGGADAVLAEAESEGEREAFESIFQQAGTSRELFHPGLFRWFTPLLLAHGTLGLSAPEAFSDGLRAAFLLGVHIRLERFGFR